MNIPGAERRDKDGLTEAQFLAQYDAGDYVRPSVAADMVIFTVAEDEKENYRRLPNKVLRLLLIQRGGHPYLGDWALPGGFVRPGETAMAAARRELREEAGLDHVYLEQLYTFSDPKRDPRTWVMSCAHMALADSSKVQLKAGDDADNALWFTLTCRLMDEHTLYLSQIEMMQEGQEVSVPGNVQTRRYRLELANGEIRLACTIEEKIIITTMDSDTRYTVLDNDGLAFDHGKIIYYALKRLRGKLEYTDLALHLMPAEFTLTQLQQVYEVIWGKTLLKAAFRRKVAALVEETDSYTSNEGHRPSRLYRRRMEEMNDG